MQLIRIALLAAGIAMAAHIVERTVHRQPVTPMSAEIGIVLALVSWAVITLPMSVWPGGSMRLLTDQYLKAIAFFWLLGTVVTSSSRMRGLSWALVLCSIPLAVTGVKNYVFGENLLSTGVRGFTRIAGYEGGSGAAEGARFGLLVALFVVCIFVVPNYVTLNIGGKLAAELALSTFFQWLLVCIVIGLIYKPAITEMH